LMWSANYGTLHYAVFLIFLSLHLPFPFILVLLFTTGRAVGLSLLGASAISWSRIIVACGPVDGMKIGKERRSTRREFAPVPIWARQIPRLFTWDRNRAAAVGASYSWQCTLEEYLLFFQNTSVWLILATTHRQTCWGILWFEIPSFTLRVTEIRFVLAYAFARS
jgi:hypothetical protein